MANFTNKKTSVALTKYLVFNLGNEKYGINIINVQEIKILDDTITLTTIIDSPPHILGIIYFNNKIVPILDLLQFYHLPRPLHHAKRILIIIICEDNFIGIVLDAPLDIFEVIDDRIKLAPPFLYFIEQNSIQGFIDDQENSFIILDVKHFLLNSGIISTMDVKGLNHDNRN